MKIVHVLNSLTIGGIEKVVVDISNNLISKENKVFIITLSNKDFSLQSKLNKDIKVISLPFKNDTNIGILRFWFLGIPSLVKIINKIKPDIVHSHLYYHYFLFLAISLKFHHLPIANFRTIHTSGMFYGSRSLINRFRLFIEKIAIKIYPSYLIAISNTIYKNNQLYFSKHTHKFKLIPNGINLKLFSKKNFFSTDKSKFGFNNDTVLVTYVARLEKGKNHDCLVKAWSKVIKINTNAHLCLIGDGILKEQLINQSVGLNLDKNITFFGTLNNVPEFLSITDIAVFPSQFEGFPISLIEKMAMGLPVVTSDIDVFKEVIVNNQNGLICSVNDPDGYAKKIIKLINDENLRIKIGKSAQETAVKYDIERITNETLSFYEEALSV
jgi:glycosyltransferase involved in cell wall biosynthesis